MEVKITDIQPNGSFQTQHGTLYSFVYTYDDNVTGVSNHKTEDCPFEVGDTVEREDNGAMSNGTLKFRTKKLQNNPGVRTQIQREQKEFSGFKERVQGTRRDGMEVGNAINNAVALITSGLLNLEQMGIRDVRSTVWQVASEILEAVDNIQSGNLAFRAVPEPKGTSGSNVRRPSDAEFEKAGESIVYEDLPPDTETVEEVVPPPDKGEETEKPPF